jgi:hypothetical protein
MLAGPKGKFFFQAIRFDGFCAVFFGKPKRKARGTIRGPFELTTPRLSLSRDGAGLLLPVIECDICSAVGAA